jgi:hypothetical protein
MAHWALPPHRHMSIALLGLLMLVVAIGAEAGSSSVNFLSRSIESSGNTIDHVSQRSLAEEDEHAEEGDHAEEGEHADEEHAHEDVLSILQWVGIFHFDEAAYTLTVRAPKEGESDSDDGHNHRLLSSSRLRSLQEENHTDHEEDSAHEDEDTHGDDNHTEGVDAHTEDEGHEEGYHFLMALVPVDSNGQDAIDEAMGVLEGLTGKENVIVELEDGDTIVPSRNHYFELYLANSSSTGSFVINITDDALHYALFLPASPSQVEVDGVHFLVGAEKEDVFPETVRLLNQESSTSSREGEKPWGQVIGATLLVNIITLIGVVFLVPTLATAVKDKTACQSLKDLASTKHVLWEDTPERKMFDIGMTSFACGALLATTVFLIIPEAISLVNSGAGDPEDPHAGHGHRMLQEDEEEGGTESWVFGACVLGGFLLPMFLASFFPHHHVHQLGPKTHEHAVVPSDEASGKLVYTIQ